jgi:hypothetical protein
MEIIKVLLYFSKITLNLKLTKLNKYDNGNLLGLDLNIEDKRITLINIYGPNVDMTLTWYRHF